MLNSKASQNNKVKKSEYDDAFETLAAFMFEQYKKKKQAQQTQNENCE